MTIAEQGIESVGPEGLRPASLIPGIMPVVKDFAYLDPQYAKVMPSVQVHKSRIFTARSNFTGFF